MPCLVLRTELPRPLSMHWGVGPSLMHPFSLTLFWEFASLNWGRILLHHPWPPMLWAGSEASSPHWRNLSGEISQKVRTKEVLCLSESLRFYAKSSTRGHFLFLISSPSSLDYRGRHTPGGFKDFCGWLGWASLLRLFFTTTVFYLHPSEGTCASGVCLQPPNPPTWNEPGALFRNEPTFFSLYHHEPTALWSAEEGREGGNLPNSIWPSRE